MSETNAEAEVKSKKAPAKKAAAPAKKAPAKKAVAAKKPLPKAEKDAKPAKAPKAEKAPKEPKPPKEPVDRSAAVAASWNDPEVKAARNLKSKVKVGGVEYGSTLKAFLALKLPVNKHIQFRSELKAAGKATFKDEATGTKYNFTLVQPAAA